MIKPGMLIGDRYEIIDKVGSGGMADVYKAKCHKLNRFVAVKIMKSEFSDDKTFISKFRGEAQSAAGLSHPNIVNVYDVGEEDGLYYIVMELVEGITLKDFIDRKGRLDIRESVGIAIQIAQGVEAAHANNIIHRDIKPQNIIISKEGKVKVADFGIAKATTSNTLTSNAMGSVHYISPEQARGGYSDEKSDIYSLGVTMYEMISGQVPFEGDSAVSIALLHIQSEAPTLGEIVPNVPISVEKIVYKCMQKKPERRYLSAGELIADLKHSILEPNVDFVVISSAMAANSPTIALSQEDLNAIRNGIVANPEEYMDQQQLMEDEYDQGYENGYNDQGYDGYDNGYDNGGYDNQSYDSYNNNGYGYDNNQGYDANNDGMNDQNGYDDQFNNDLVDKNSFEDEEEPSDEAVDPRVEKITKYIAYGVVAIIIFVLLYLVYIAIFDTTGGGKDDEPTQAPVINEEDSIEMPKVVGMSFEEAKQKLVDAGFSADNIEKTEAIASSEGDIGKVIETDPSDGSKVAKNAKIKLTVGIQEQENKKTVQIPDVSGLKLSEARLKLLSLFPNAEVVPESMDGDPKVKGSSPSAGKKLVADYSGTISLTVEDDSVEIPSDINGQDANNIKSALEGNGLSVSIKEESSDRVEQGCVISSNPKAGSKVKKGSTVTLIVSKGKEIKEKDQKRKVFVQNQFFQHNPEDSGELVITLTDNSTGQSYNASFSNVKAKDIQRGKQYDVKIKISESSDINGFGVSATWNGENVDAR